jgi:hypothetical protein
MDVLVKRIQSPEAKRHKVEYDTKYESSPKRVKYREELNQERRKRGMYGDGSHRDISHTQGDKLTVEDEHDNRARHFKDKGTLRPVQKSCDCEHCTGMHAAIDLLEKKLCPAGKAAAKRKFKVYPSAYANGWAVQYCRGKFRGKKKGGKKK